MIRSQFSHIRRVTGPIAKISLKADSRSQSWRHWHEQWSNTNRLQYSTRPSAPHYVFPSRGMFLATPLMHTNPTTQSTQVSVGFQKEEHGKKQFRKCPLSTQSPYSSRRGSLSPSEKKTNDQDVVQKKTVPMLQPASNTQVLVCNKNASPQFSNK